MNRLIIRLSMKDKETVYIHIRLNRIYIISEFMVDDDHESVCYLEQY